MPRLVHLVALVLVLAPLGAASGGETAPATAPDGAPPATAPEPPAREGRVPFAGPRPVLGFSLNAHHISNLSLYLESIDRIAALGANTLVVVTPMFQEHVDSSEIRIVPRKCPKARQLLALLRRAEERGLATVLLPIVLIEHPGEEDWRGVIEPRDPDAWWASYDRFMDYFAGIAAAADVDLLAVGSELNSTENELARWTRLVERVRSVYDGPLTYSANWDRYDKVTFWPLVDVLSVSAYFELLPDEPDAPVEALAAAWAEQRDRLVSFAEARERPLLLSEVGYPSLPWASAHPWNYVAGADTPADHESQARAYRAFFEAWSDAVAAPGAVAGFCCYHWDPYHHGQAGDTGYGVDGKPAHDVVAEGFRRIRADRDGGAAPATAD